LASSLSGYRSNFYASPYIRINWNDPNVNEQGHKVERKDATSGQWLEKATLDSNYTSWSDVDLMGSETYTYRMKAYNIHQNSNYSNEKVIKARPSTPTNFVVRVECVGYSPKIIPTASSSPVRPPVLYDEGPPCTEYTNAVFLSWSPPVNQKLSINHYMIKVTTGLKPDKYAGPVYNLVDTLCLEEKNKLYHLYVYAIDSEGDTGWSSSVQTVTTGSRTSLSCGDFVEKYTTILPENFYLAQNYPNPFNSSTQIGYGLPLDAHVKLTIYNILGEKVRVLVDEYQSAGERNIIWDGKNENGEVVATGIYLYRIEAGSFTKTAKMSLLK